MDPVIRLPLLERSIIRCKKQHSEYMITNLNRIQYDGSPLATSIIAHPMTLGQSVMLLYLYHPYSSSWKLIDYNGQEWEVLS